MPLHLQQKAFFFFLLSFTIWSWWTLDGVVSDPQTTLVTVGCSLTNVSDVSIFQDNLNKTFRVMRTQISNQSKHFATDQELKGNNPAYGLFQCRNYLSIADCLTCFDVAADKIQRNCSAAVNGAHIIYDGCFLRYESSTFFEQSTDPVNNIHCGNETRNSTELASTVQQVLRNLEIATPRISGHFAATKTTVPNSNGSNIYAFAQCLETLTQSGCDNCLNIALRNFQICLPNSDAKAFDFGCFMRYSTTAFFADNQTTNINHILNPGDSSKKKAIIGGVVSGASFILILFALLALYMRAQSLKMVPKGDILGATELKGPVNFRYKDLKSATKNFSEKNKIGEGFGDVYKGTLKNGKVVAIKKLDLGQSKHMEKDFESEVKLISNVHHRNIIRLLGCCSRGQERFLVYEHMNNNNVGRFLSGEGKGSLSWMQRYGIILGTARGLAYLHEEFHVCIIHRNVKTSNILLDDDFQPKISDFGLAKLLPRDQSHLNTQFAGTTGYVAPEYAMHGQLSGKVDTYSYGVVVLEIISGQKSSALKANDGEYLLQRAWKLYERGMLIEFVDKTLDPNEYDAEEVKKIIEIGLLCTQASPSARPRMSEIVRMLKRKSLMEHKEPTMPVYVDPMSWPKKEDNSMTDNSSSSNATASISVLAGR